MKRIRITFVGVMSAGALAIGGCAAGESPSPTTLATATASVAPTPSPTDSPSPSPITPAPATPTAEPTPTLAPTASAPATPSQAPGSTNTRTIHLDGSEYTNATVPQGSRVRKLGQTTVIDSTSDSTDATWVTWTMPVDSLPPDAHVVDIDSAICGSGEGDFWEVYGPQGSEPDEYEATAPSGDGCWHFMNAPGTGLDITAGVLLDSHMTITGVEFDVTYTVAAP